jgi:NAD(P)-dependent dehydrogenase (short-subunit alcohol dehydrogenase family)
MATQAARVAIVTGSARGIGRACAHALAQRGYAMALVDVLLPEMMRTRAEIEKMNRPCLSYQADVALHDRVREVVDYVIRRWGRVDVLVNNAGKAQPKGITELSEAEWNATIDLNLKSCFNWIQPLAASRRLLADLLMPRPRLALLALRVRSPKSWGRTSWSTACVLALSRPRWPAMRLFATESMS